MIQPSTSTPSPGPQSGGTDRVPAGPGGHDSAGSLPVTGRFGRYEIIRRLATGGMGEVYLARSVGAAGFRKHLVIKKILPHLVEHPQFVEGLVREAKLLVMLDHPNIVQVYDLGREGNDTFMAMEFVHGYNLATIAHYCAQKRLLIPANVCAYIAIQVLAGLEYAHSFVGAGDELINIVHRDVSPQNVLISRDGRVKLADFGIAKILNEADTEATKSLKGKFRYMAPEAVDGRRIDHRYDLFAVGILLFESLCRRHLFGGRSDVDILEQVRLTEVPPIARYHPGVAADLVAVAERALRRDVNRRYQDASEFAAALRSAMQPESEIEAARELRRFIKDLYERPDFPVNKPKLPDLNELDPNVTRSIILHSDLGKAPPVSRWSLFGSTSLLWTAFFLMSAAVAYLAYLMLGRDESAPKKPVIIQVEPRRVPMAVASSLQATDSAAATPGPVAGDDAAAPKKLSRRNSRQPQRARPFTEAVGRAAFSRSGNRLRDCFDRHSQAQSGEISLKVVSTIRSSGRVESVRIEPARHHDTPLGKCIKRVAKRVRYPRHNKRLVNFLQPLRVTRPGAK